MSVFNVSGAGSLPPGVLAEPTASAGYLCQCMPYAQSMPGAVWNQSAPVNEQYRHVARPVSHVPMPICVQRSDILPAPVLDILGSGLLQWPGDVSAEPATPGESIAATLGTGRQQVLSTSSGSVYVKLLALNSSDTRARFKPLWDPVSSDAESTRVYCALVNATAEAHLRRGLWTAWPMDPRLDLPPFAASIEDAAFSSAELGIPAVPMVPCYGIGVSSSIEPEIQLSGEHV